MMKSRTFFCLLASSLVAVLSASDPAVQPQRVRRSHSPEPKANEIFFSADLLVWDAREEGLEYAYRNSGTLSDQSLASYEPGSKFEPGFRLGAGGFLPYDSWMLGAEYTYYHTKRNSSASFSFNRTGTPGPGMIAVWTYPSAFSNNNNGARFASAKNEWKLHTSFLDLALSRPCKIASFFTATPSFGIRSAWLHQRYQTDYGDGNLIVFGAGNQVTVLSSGVDMNCDSDNVGLLFACGLKWTLGQNWDLFSDLSGSFLASHFDVKRSETDLFLNSLGALQTQSARLKSEYWTFRPQGQLSLGIRYSNDFRYGSRLVRWRASAAYEAQMWWKQNQLLRYLDVQNGSSSGANVAPVQGDLMFHGADIEAGFDF